MFATKTKEIGGDTVLENERVMRELAAAGVGSANTSSGPESRPGGGRPFDSGEPREEIVIRKKPSKLIPSSSTVSLRSGRGRGWAWLAGGRA